MSEHNKREGYWQYYELAKEVEASRVTLIENSASHAAVQELVDVKPD